MDADTLKLLYALKESQNAEWEITPAEIVAFLSSNQKSLSALADASMPEKIGLLKSITDAVMADKALDEARLAELTGMDAGQARQLSLLYTYKNGDTAGWRLSTEQFIGFLSDEVLNDSEMSDRIGADDRKKLTGASAVVKAVLSGKPYTSQVYCRQTAFAVTETGSIDRTRRLQYNAGGGRCLLSFRVIQSNPPKYHVDISKDI